MLTSTKSTSAPPVSDAVPLMSFQVVAVYWPLPTGNVMLVVGAVVSMSHVSLASPSSRFPAASWMPEPVAVSVSTYVPSSAVTELRSIVYEPPVPSTVSPLRSTAAPSNVRLKSSISTPVTGSLNVIVTSPTAALRGSGVTEPISAVGGVLSIV